MLVDWGILEVLSRHANQQLQGFFTSLPAICSERKINSSESFLVIGKWQMQGSV